MLQCINNKELRTNSKIYDLPDQYFDKTFSNFNAYSENLLNKKELCYKFALGETEKKSVVMTGTVGSGKTHLAVMIAKNLPFINGTCGKRPQTVKFCVADELFSMFNDLVYEKKSKLMFIKEQLRSDILIIDDLGIANFSKAKQENLYLLINRAYLDQKKLIITTNFTLEQLSDYDERIISRLIEMAIILKFNEKDYRVKTK
jgi:DNA replication protein DnaC